MTQGVVTDDPYRAVLEGSGPMPLDVALAAHGEAVDRVLRWRRGGPTRSGVFAQVLFGDGATETLIPRIRLLRAALGQPPSEDPIARAAADHLAGESPPHQVGLWHGFVEGEEAHREAAELPLVDLRAALASEVDGAGPPDLQLRSLLIRGVLGDDAVGAFEVSLGERARGLARPPRNGTRVERVGWWLVAVGVAVNVVGLLLTAAAILTS